jgi:thioredoxin 2
MDAPIVTCPHCGTRNRVSAEMSGGDRQPKCGRCRKPLPDIQSGHAERKFLVLRCGQCQGKNRVPMDKLHENPKCGRCKAPLPHQDLMSGRPVTVRDNDFSKKVLQSPLPVLLYAWAPWCSVCSGTNSMVDQLAEDTRGKFRVAKVNIQTNPKTAAQYDIMSVPSFFIFDGGRLKLHLPGAVPKHELILKMAAYLK